MKFEGDGESKSLQGVAFNEIKGFMSYANFTPYANSYANLTDEHRYFSFV